MPPHIEQPVIEEGLRVAVVGATGAVGREIVKCLERRSFPVGELRLLASNRSAGSTIEFRGKPRLVEVLTHERLKALDLVLFSASTTVSREFAPNAVPDGRGRAARHPRSEPARNRDPQRAHREPQLLGDHCDHAALAAPSGVPHPADRGVDVPSSLGRGRRGAGGACGVYASASRRTAVCPERAAPSLCVQPVQPYERHRHGVRLQRRRAEGHP